MEERREKVDRRGVEPLVFLFVYGGEPPPSRTTNRERSGSTATMDLLGSTGIQGKDLIQNQCLKYNRFFFFLNHCAMICISYIGLVNLLFQVEFLLVFLGHESSLTMKTVALKCLFAMIRRNIVYHDIASTVFGALLQLIDDDVFLLDYALCQSFKHSEYQQFRQQGWAGEGTHQATKSAVARSCTLLLGETPPTTLALSPHERCPTVASLAPATPTSTRQRHWTSGASSGVNACWSPRPNSAGLWRARVYTRRGSWPTGGRA